MNKELALRIMMLLSAMESFSFSKDRGFLPDYLHDELQNIQDELKKEVLK